MAITSEQAAEAQHQFQQQVLAKLKSIEANIGHILDAFPPKKTITPSAEFLSPCQTLVNGLFEEASAFKGAVPTVVRNHWLKSIEACKGKIPETEYNKALAILRADA